MSPIDCYACAITCECGDLCITNHFSGPKVPVIDTYVHTYVHGDFHLTVAVTYVFTCIFGQYNGMPCVGCLLTMYCRIYVHTLTYVRTYMCVLTYGGADLRNILSDSL